MSHGYFSKNKYFIACVLTACLFMNVPHANSNMYMANLRNVQAYFTCLANINMYMVNSRHALIRVHVQYKSCNDVLFLAFAGHTFDKNWY